MPSSSVDFIECDTCGRPVPSNRTIRSQAGRVVCTDCSHAGEGGAPHVSHADLLSQQAALPWTPAFIECIGVVHFDLHVGQVVEYLYPALPFSATQETELAFLCFPDANHSGDGDAFHDFMYAYNKSEFDFSRDASPERSHRPPPKPKSANNSRRVSHSDPTSPDVGASPAEPPQASSPSVASSASPVGGHIGRVAASVSDFRREEADSPTGGSSNADVASTPPEQATPADPQSRNPTRSETQSPGPPQQRRGPYDATVEERFCSTMFRQRKDASIERGAQQKAVFVMSAYPFPALFHKVLSRLADALFATPGSDMATVLASAWADLERWPRPLPCRHHAELPLIGEVLSYSTPEYDAVDIVQPIWSVASPKSRLTAHERSPLDRLRWALERRTVDETMLCETIAAWEATRHDELPAVAAWLETQAWNPTRRRFTPLPTESPRGGDVPVVLPELPSHDALQELRLLLRAEEKPDCPPFSLLDPSPAVSEAPPRGIIMRQPSETLLGLFRHSYEVTNAIVSVQNGALMRSLHAAAAAMEQLQLGGGTEVPREERRAVLTEMEVHTALFPHITKTWKLWELMIVGAPIACVAPTAPVVSAMALSIAGLVSPLPWVGLLRPYVTINNREIDHGIDRRPGGATIVGATNPFFVRHLDAWPHMVCQGADMAEATNHKMWPADSDKRQKQQFKLKNRMFCSRHYLVRTDKGSSFGTSTKQPAPSRVTFVDETGAISSPSRQVFDTFRGLTREFVAPLENFVRGVMKRHQPYFLSDSQLQDLLSRKAAIEYLHALVPPPPSFSRFKNAKDATEVYDGFLRGPLGQRWLQCMVRLHYRRFLVEDVSSLEDVIRLCPTVGERFDALALLQGDLDRCINHAVLDVPLTRKLMELCAEAAALRSALVAPPE